MRLRSWIFTIVGLSICLGAAWGAYLLADYSWNQVVNYRGPYLSAALPATTAATTSADDRQRVPAGVTVFVIVDGLREDVSRTMPNLEKLRSRGFDAVVRTSQPSLSFPNWTTLLSGAPQRISGVTTNWFEEKVPVETLIDVALSTGATVAVSAPKDFQMLYDVRRTGHTYLRDWTEGEYMTDDIVDNAVRLAAEVKPALLIVHFPDIDEAGHAHGGGSKEYRAMASKVDTDLGRLIRALQSGSTTFIVASDHGHIDTGGHGGPEAIVTDVPAVFAGASVKPGRGTGVQYQVAPTVAVLAGLPIPRNAADSPLDVMAGEATWASAVDSQQFRAYDAYLRAVAPGPVQASDLETGKSARGAFEAATSKRLASERAARLPMALGLLLGCLVALALVAVLSRESLLAALAGAAVYFAAWNGSYFVIHGYRWSLSSFNSESYLKSFLNGRMTDAVIAGLIAAALAAVVRLLTARRTSVAVSGGSWAATGVATLLVIQAALGLQVAWYLWYWGASVTWVIPDLALGFKYDLDLIQLTGSGAAALLAPLVALAIGRVSSRRAAQTAPAQT